MTFKLWNFETILNFNNPSSLSSFDKALPHAPQNVSGKLQKNLGGRDVIQKS